jgi:hypothetical protein
MWECTPCAPIDEILHQADEHVTRDLTSVERANYLNEQTD